MPLWRLGLLWRLVPLEIGTPMKIGTLGTEKVVDGIVRGPSANRFRECISGRRHCTFIRWRLRNAYLVMKKLHHLGNIKRVDCPEFLIRCLLLAQDIEKH